MKLPDKLVIWVVVFCLWMAGAFSAGPWMGDLHAQGLSEEDLAKLKKEQQTATQAELKNNFDKDFLTKDTISPSTTGFIDRLDIPATLSPLAAKNVLNGIASAGQRVVAVGIRGHIVYSDDGGKSWSQARVPVSVDLTAVFFPTPKRGWAVGHDGVVLHSADGGATWTKNLDGYGACRIMHSHYQKHPVSGKLQSNIQFMIEQGPVNPFRDVWFESESTGFIVGAFNLIFRTEDGGKSWEPWFDRTDNPGGLHLYAIRSVGRNIYISGEQGLLLKFDSREKRFKAQKTPYHGTFFGILGRDDALIAFGMRGNIYRSTNGGVSWGKINTPVPSALLGGAISPDGSIILVSQGGNVIVSKDGGKSFVEIKQETNMSIPAHAMVAVNNTLIIAGWGGVKLQKLQ